MGFFAHHSIIITASSEKEIAASHAKAREMMPDVTTPIFHSPINGFATFFIAPDGSKEGRIDSDLYAGLRTQFCNWLDLTASSVDYALVRYGGDEPELRVLERGNWEQPEEE